MPTINDADGHINDYFFGDEIARYMPEGNQFSQLFPVFDHLSFPLPDEEPRAQVRRRQHEDRAGPRGVLQFIEETGIA